MSKSDDSGDENQPSITESDSEITDDEEEIEKEMGKTPVNPQQLAFTPPTPRLITSKSPLHPEVSTSPDTPSSSRSTPPPHTPSACGDRRTDNWKEMYKTLHKKYVQLKEKVRILEQSSQRGKKT